MKTEGRAFCDAIILCPGPKLLRAWSVLQSRVTGALLFGVNRAVEFWPCDYWVALDWPMFSSGKPKGSPEMITSTATARKLGRLVFRAYDYRTAGEDLPGRGDHWLCYSMLTAIVAAYDLGCTDIKIYGCDWAGSDDWDGNQSPKVRRSENRWERERKYFQKLVDWLGVRGVLVARVLNENNI